MQKIKVDSGGVMVLELAGMAGRSQQRRILVWGLGFGGVGSGRGVGNRLGYRYFMYGISLLLCITLIVREEGI
jgi:hypothetical protein